MGQRKRRVEYNIFTCEACGKVFEARPSDGLRRFCCSECRYKNGTRVHRVIVKTCPICGKQIEALPHLASRKPILYCSFKCARAGQRGPRTLIPVRCGTCGKLMHLRPHEVKEGKRFCSRACANKHSKHPELVKVCRGCGTTFMVDHSHRAYEFCSKKCFLNSTHRQPVTCPICQGSFVPQLGAHGQQKYCSPVCQAAGRRKPRVTVLCKHCGKTIEVLPGIRKRRKYCSKTCQMLSMFSSEEENLVIAMLAILLAEEPIRQHTFPWLRNRHPMRIDAYFPVHNLAVEYDGAQHYTYKPFYHSTIQQYTALQERDRLKEELLTAHGIPLLRVLAKEPKTPEHLTQRLTTLPILPPSESCGRP